MSQEGEYNLKKNKLIEILSGTIDKAMKRVRHKDKPHVYLSSFFKNKKTNKPRSKKMLTQICKWMYTQKIIDAPESIAYLTFGRWQPPHKGHSLLIENVLSHAFLNNGHAYVVVTEKPTINSTYFNDKPELKYKQEMRNPLSLQKKINYLNKMFPPTLDWIDLENEIIKFPLLKYYPFNFSFMYQGTRNDIKINGFSRFIKYRKRGFGSGSTGILAKLRELGYKKFAIIVASDRVELFKQTNPGINVIQHGEDRGTSGSGEVLNEISDNLELNLDFLENFDIENYSGSKLRYAARNPGYTQQLKNGIIHNYDYFKHSVKIGKMTDKDIEDLITEIQYRTPKEKNETKEPGENFSRLDTNESGTRIKLFTARNGRGGKRKKERKTRKTRKKRK